ncbi:hypothetical protein [Amycolatopsis thermoflava]|nr:hypothetical protein [Amycolatopsis thermoflava]
MVRTALGAGRDAPAAWWAPGRDSAVAPVPVRESSNLAAVR